MIPLILRLKKALHRDIAQAQDLIIETMYSILGDAVLHGGTCIWRCYKGNRFSEDIDVYLPKNLSKIESFYALLENKGFTIIKKRIKVNSIYSVLDFRGRTVSFEAVFKKVGGILKEYETAEGNYITVYALSPEDLIEEKVKTYLKRRKVRDLFDLFFLLRYVPMTREIKDELRDLITFYKEPVDEKDLKIIILEGVVPSVGEMIEYIKRRV